MPAASQKLIPGACLYDQHLTCELLRVCLQVHRFSNFIHGTACLYDQHLTCELLRLCLQVHKFSKFIHGTATLLPDMVQAVPYWVDDESVRPSMLQSAARDAHPIPGAAP